MKIVDALASMKPKPQLLSMNVQRVGHACLAQFDDAFYRAVIESIDTNEKTAVVRFIDYGNAEIKKQATEVCLPFFCNYIFVLQIYALTSSAPAVLRTQPAQAWSVRLNGIRSTKWTPYTPDQWTDE